MYHAYTLREPVGVVGQIIPWNFPLLMAAWKLAPALASGCTVVLKPAEQTPLSALRLGELIQEAGFPDGVVNIVPGYGETAGAALAAHDLVDKIAFTGSTEVGKLIVHAATGNLKKVSLELGGKSPNVVFKDADLDTAIAGAASAIFFNHGQCCCAGSRLYVERPVFDRVVEGVAAKAKKINVGSGMDAGHATWVRWSPKSNCSASAATSTSACQEGAKAIDRRQEARRQRLFCRADSSHQHQRKYESRAGRNLRPGRHRDSIRQSRRTRHARQRFRSTAWPLASGRTTSRKAHRTAALLRAGTVWINCYNIFDAALPFGGYKQSGWGREMGKDVLNSTPRPKQSARGCRQGAEAGRGRPALHPIVGTLPY